MNPQDFQTEIDDQNAQTTADQQKHQELTLHTQNSQAVIDTIAQATKALIAFQKTHQPKVSVTNQKLPISIKTPDIQKVVDALEKLKQPILENKIDHTPVIEALSQLNDSVSKLPTAFPEIPSPVKEVTIKNQPNYTKQFDLLGKAIKGIDVKPVVNIPTEKPDDYTPILDSLEAVLLAVKNIKIPETPETDLTPLVNATAAVQESIQNLRFPVANYVLPFVDVNGKATQAPISLVDKAADDIEFTNADGNGNYRTITYYANGVVARTLSLLYDANNKVTSIVRS